MFDESYAVATSSESEPVLESRLLHAGFPQADVDKSKVHVKSLRQLPFVSSYTPGSSDETPLMAVLDAMLGAQASLAQKAPCRVS